MDTQKVTLRKMTPEEYDAATEHREAETARALDKFMPDDLARERGQHRSDSSVPGQRL